MGLTFSLIVTESDTNKQVKATEEVTQSHYPGINIVTEVIEDPNYHMAIHRPLFEEDSLTELVLTYVNQQQEEFLEEVKQNQPYLEERQWQANFYLTFDIYQVNETLYSFVFNAESYVAGANGRQSSKVFMVDLQENATISAQDMFDDSTEMYDNVHQQLKKAFESSPDYQEMFFEEALLEWKQETDLSNLYVTEDALMFTFDKYEVTAGAAGSPEIALPLSDFHTFLKEDWRARLNIEIENDISTGDTTSGAPDEEQIDIDDHDDEENSQETKVVALTFDDGPHPKNTLKALQLLDKYDMTATFFMLGSRIDFYPDLVREVFNRGHEIGNHTWNHKQLTKISDAAIQEEVNRVDQVLLDINHQAATVFRPPYGSTNTRVEQYVDVPTVLWTIDTLDWKTKDPDAIFVEVKENLKPGAIILMHDIHATTIEALELVLPYLEEQGYTSVEVSKVLEMNH